MKSYLYAEMHELFAIEPAEFEPVVFPAPPYHPPEGESPPQPIKRRLRSAHRTSQSDMDETDEDEVRQSSNYL